MRLAMPLYEYRCHSCRKRVTILTLRISEPAQLVCDRCGSSKLERLMSRFSTTKSEEARLESLADPRKLGDLNENDPKSMARWMKRMGRELGDEFGGGELNEMVDDLERAGEEDSENGADSAGDDD